VCSQNPLLFHPQNPKGPELLNFVVRIGCRFNGGFLQSEAQPQKESDACSKDAWTDGDDGGELRAGCTIDAARHIAVGGRSRRNSRRNGRGMSKIDSKYHKMTDAKSR
jgi:hypothetical protein